MCTQILKNPSVPHENINVLDNNNNCLSHDTDLMAINTLSIIIWSVLYLKTLLATYNVTKWLIPIMNANIIFIHQISISAE